ncbi:MAG: DUF1761 domain-containing protein [Novosphingobium sp.]
MGPVNWLAVILAANLAVAVGLVWYGPLFRTGRPLLAGKSAAPKGYGLAVVVMLLAAWLMGHNFARIGAETLSAKPWLYYMMTAGFAVFIAAPTLFLGLARYDVSLRNRLIDGGYWIVAFLAMGAVFHALG